MFSQNASVTSISARCVCIRHQRTKQRDGKLLSESSSSQKQHATENRIETFFQFSLRINIALYFAKM